MITVLESWMVCVALEFVLHSMHLIGVELYPKVCRSPLSHVFLAWSVQLLGGHYTVRLNALAAIEMCARANAGEKV